MKKFFSEYPILATCLTSSIIILLVGAFVTSLIVYGVAKGVTSISKSIESNIPENAKNKASYKYIAGNSASTNKILAIPIAGIILTSENPYDPFSFLLTNVTYGYSVKTRLMKVANDPQVKGVVLEIDSPGGTITGAKAISDGVEYFRQKTGNPVVAHISGLGASGAYWVSASSNQIMADTGSLSGSIGVIIGPFKYYNKVLSESTLTGSVTTEKGIESLNITAGTDKDFDDPYKKLSTSAQKILQAGIDNEYDIFVNYISSNRKIPADKIRDEIGAMVYGNKQALELGLIDSVGNRQDAYLKSSELAKLNKDDFQVVTDEGIDFWSRLFKVVSPTKLYNKATECPICGQMLFLFGNPEDYILTRTKN